ncbi:MAG: ArnT family glycosyltransferase, partial [Planctomycetota bacterium]
MGDEADWGLLQRVREGVAGAFADPASGERGLVGLLFIAGLLLRLLSALRVQVVATDAVRYLEIARLFSAGEFRAALAHDYHPLYPLLIALFRPFFGGLENAAFAVPLLLSAFTLPLLYGFFRTIFGRSPAFIAAAVFAVLPPLVRPGADTLSEGVFHFFLILSLYLGARAYREKTVPFALAAGLSAGCSYLVRPEGLGVVVAFGAFTAALLLAGWKDHGRLRATLAGLLRLATFLGPAAPYLIHLRLESGSW